MAEHGIIGDSFGTELPQTDVAAEDLNEELKMAKFSKTAEFQRLKDYLEARIKFYQTCLPDGTLVDSKTSVQDWLVANAIIAEFTAVIEAYERAQEVVRER